MDIFPDHLDTDVVNFSWLEIWIFSLEGYTSFFQVRFKFVFKAGVELSRGTENPHKYNPLEEKTVRKPQTRVHRE